MNHAGLAGARRRDDEEIVEFALADRWHRSRAERCDDAWNGITVADYQDGLAELSSRYLLGECIRPLLWYLPRLEAELFGERPGGLLRAGEPGGQDRTETR